MFPSRAVDSKILKFVRKGYVKVLESGTVISGATSKPMGTVRKNGYVQVCMKRDGVHFLCYAHRIVALVHLGRPAEQSMQVNHIDGNKSNNIPSNLEWVSAKTNLAHARALGLTYDYGEHNAQAKITDDDAENIRKSKLSNRVLASKYGIRASTVANIKSGRSRKPPTVEKLEKNNRCIPEVVLLRVIDSMLPPDQAAGKFSLSVAKIEAIRTKSKYRRLAECNNCVVHPAWVYSYVRNGVQSEVARSIITSCKPVPRLARQFKLPEAVVRDIYNGVTHTRLRKYLGVATKPIRAISKLTMADVKTILQLDWTQAAIASKYGISRATVSHIQNGKSFRHVTAKG